MMNPEEKAKDLVKKHLDYFGINRDEVEEEKAKNSAMITVNEILSDLASYRYKHYLTVEQAVELSAYWQNVKYEINLI